LLRCSLNSKILFFGSRNWTYKHMIKDVIWSLLVSNQAFTMIEGEARGADTLSRQVAEMFPEHINIIQCPANWNKYGKAAGYMRNIEMRSYHPDLGICFHEDLFNSKGSLMMFNLLREWNIPVWYYNALKELTIYE
jgi:hypothetical protein